MKFFIVSDVYSFYTPIIEALDACTALSNQVNILVVEDDFV